MLSQRGVSRSVIEANPHLYGPLPITGAPPAGQPKPPGITLPGEVADAQEGKKRRSKAEAEFEQILIVKFPGSDTRYEPVVFRIAPKVSYKPDFGVFHPDGSVDFYEVKGAYLFKGAHKSHTTATLVKPQVAATQWPMFTFHSARKSKRKEWKIITYASKA